jgi:hypothetical protein
MKVLISLTTATAIMVAAATSVAQVPERISYQVMLTNDMDQPIAEQSVEMDFRIYAQESGGTDLWSEHQSVATNSVGVVSVILGSVSPLSISFSGPRWLEVDVDGSILGPRRELVAVPYARQAHDSETVGGVPAAAFALSDTLSVPGTLNAAGNPVDWSRLKNVPVGFADGTDDLGGGVGDGHSLDASDGDPVDALFIDQDGGVVVGDTTYWAARLEITTDTDETGVYIAAESSDSFNPAQVAVTDASNGVVANAGGSLSSFWIPGTGTAALVGIGNGNARGAYLSSQGSARGMECNSGGTGEALYAQAFGDGFAGRFVGGEGVFMERSDGYPILQIENTTLSNDNDGLYVTSGSGALSSTWTLDSECWSGTAGRFEKATDDDVYAVYVYGADPSSEGIFVRGTVASTSLAARVVETTRGEEAVFGVTAPEVEVIASGTGRLADGFARVDFDRLFTETITGDEDLRVTASPVGAWSALYIEHVDGTGFDLRSDAGDLGVDFHWVAIGRSRTEKERPELTIPDAEEEARIAERKRAAREERRALTSPPAEVPAVVEAVR